MHPFEDNVLLSDGKKYKVLYLKPSDVGYDTCDGCVLDDNENLCFEFQNYHRCTERNQVVKVTEEVTSTVGEHAHTIPSPFGPGAHSQSLGPMSNVKPTNPKDKIGVTKIPYSTVPAQVLAEVSVAMLEGALKYGKHNYRDAGVLATVYHEATERHLSAWIEGEDIDPDSGLSHITKAIASLMVLRDAMMNDMWVDNRPPKPKNPDWMRDLNKKVQQLLEKYPEPVPPFTQKRREENEL